MKEVSIVYRPKNDKDHNDMIAWLDGCGYRINGDYGSTICTDKSIQTAYIGNYSNRGTKRHDCGTNLELAKALVALDDENDNLQWYVFIPRSKNAQPYWFVCYGDNYVQWCKSNPPLYNSKVMAHKATMQELLEKFNER